MIQSEGGENTNLESSCPGEDASREKARCPDILTQAAAVNAALDAFGRELLSSHIRTCVAEDVLAGRRDTVDELLTSMQKFMK